MKTRVLVIAAALALAGEASWARVAVVGDFASRIEDAVAGGALGRSQADLYWLYAIKAPERLPGEYQTTAPLARRANRELEPEVPLTLRCGTSVLRGIQSRLPLMPATTREEAEALLRPSFVGRTPRAARTVGKTAEHLLTNWVETENFSIEWGPDITDENGSPAVDEDGDGIPDVVQRWADLFERSYSIVVEERGFTHELLDQSLVPVYIGNSDPDSVIDDVGFGVYGFTTGFRGELPYIVVNNDLRFAAQNDEGRSVSGPAWEVVDANVAGTMKITAAHEFFHVVHILYLPPEWRGEEDDWWIEASSSWMEDEVFDHVNDYYQRFTSRRWASYVENSLQVKRSDPLYGFRAYGNVILAKYLAEHIGGIDSMKRVWDRIRSGERGLVALDRYAGERGLTGLEDLYLGFAGATGDMDYEEGAFYGYAPGETVPFRSTNLEVSAPGNFTGLPAPEYLGMTFLRESGRSGPLRVSVRGLGGTGTLWGLALTIGRAAGYSVVLKSADPAGAAITVASLAPEDTLTLAVSNLGTAESPVYQTRVEIPLDPGGVSAAPPAGLRAAPAAGRGPGLGGITLSWVPAPEEAVAGYVVRWRTGEDGYASRTVAGVPVNPDTGEVELSLRNLVPGAPYDIQVFSYDDVGNEGSPGRVPAVVAGPAPDAEVPGASILARNVVDAGVNVPEAGSGSKGIGGIDCFLRSLGRW